MKKIFSLLIIATLTFTLFSCKQNEFIIDDDSKIDFLGTTFNVFSNGEWLTDARKRGSSASTDRFIDRVEEIENKYNVKIHNECANLETKILSMTLNGGGGVDMLYCGNDSLYSFYNLGILTPFEEIGVNDWQNTKFGIPSLLLEGTFGGIQYGIINYLGDTVPSLNGLISINMNLLKEFSVTDPHELVEKREWNWENLRVVLAQCTFNDGEINHVGMASDYPTPGARAFFGAIIANGGFLIKEIDGVYKTGISDPNAIEAMEFMTGLVNDGLLNIGPSGSCGDIWNEGKTWTFLNDGQINSNTETDIVFSSVRFPYGPSGNQDIVAAYSFNRSFYAFTILSSYANNEIGVIVDDLFEPLDTSLYPEGWKDYSIENLFYNDSDYETYLIGLNSINLYPLGVLYGTHPWSHTGEVESAFDNILFGRGSAQSEIDSVKNILQDLINETLNVGK